MTTIGIPPQLAEAVEEDDDPARHAWLAQLPAQIEGLASAWELDLGEPYLPGGQCAWVAPERCVPGHTLGSAAPEAAQDVVVARLLRRLWEHEPAARPFASLNEMCDDWATSFELGLDLEPDHCVDPGLAHEALTIFRELPATAERTVLLCTDLHAGNILAAQREPWLVIDPKPFIGDPAYDVVQHMLNCDERLESDPARMARRMAALLDLDPDRVTCWLFARCTQESLHDPTMREPARRLAP